MQDLKNRTPLKGCGGILLDVLILKKIVLDTSKTIKPCNFKHSRFLSTPQKSEKKNTLLASSINDYLFIYYLFKNLVRILKQLEER